MYSKITIAVLLTVCVSLISADERCKSPEKNGVFMADLTDCKSYYVCSNGNLLRGTCPAGFLFNEEGQLCDFPQNVRCTSCDEKKGIYTQSIKDDCEQYLMCFNGIPIVQTCAKGLAYNPEIRACDLADNVACLVEEEVEALKCPSSGLHYIENPESCSSYYVCFNGAISPVAFKCAGGLVFNTKDGECQIATKDLYCPSEEDPTRY